MSVKFTLPLDEGVAEKMTFIGKYYGRSRIKEVEWACKEWIRRFEEECGKIMSSGHGRPLHPDIHSSCACL